MWPFTFLVLFPLLIWTLFYIVAFPIAHPLLYLLVMHMKADTTSVMLKWLLTYIPQWIFSYWHCLCWLTIWMTKMLVTWWLRIFHFILGAQGKIWVNCIFYFKANCYHWSMHGPFLVWFVSLVIFYSLILFYSYILFFFSHPSYKQLLYILKCLVLFVMLCKIHIAVMNAYDIYMYILQCPIIVSHYYI